MFAPNFATLAASINWGLLIASNQVTDDLPLPDSTSSWGQFLVGTGGPMAVGYFWYRRYNRTIQDRSQFLEDEVADNRKEISEIRKLRNDEQEEMFSLQTQFQEIHLENQRLLSELARRNKEDSQ